jgi:hypothetical protein
MGTILLAGTGLERGPDSTAEAPFRYERRNLAVARPGGYRGAIGSQGYGAFSREIGMGVSRSGSASNLMLGPAAARTHLAAPSDEPERAASTRRC